MNWVTDTIEHWVIEVEHDHKVEGQGLAGIHIYSNNPQPHKNCHFDYCPGEGWQSMSEAFFSKSNQTLENERREMVPRPLEVCIAKCYAKTDSFDVWSSNRGVPYRLRNIDTGEVIPLAALGL